MSRLALTINRTGQYGVIYDECVSHFGEEKARQYYEANNEALAVVTNLIKKHGIACDFKQDHAYIYTRSVDQLPKLINEHLAY